MMANNWPYHSYAGGRDGWLQVMNEMEELAFWWSAALYGERLQHTNLLPYAAIVPSVTDTRLRMKIDA